jgi:hypothetical protein
MSYGFPRYPDKHVLIENVKTLVYTKGVDRMPNAQSIVTDQNVLAYLDTEEIHMTFVEKSSVSQIQNVQMIRHAEMKNV